MSARQLIILGTASQTPTRLRSHNGYVLRWDDLLIMFDPGEGTQRQCTLAGVSIAKLDALCITHFHGDHCLGLPGVIQRRSLDNNQNNNISPSLPILFPADGSEYLEHMRHASVYSDASYLERFPIDKDGLVTKIDDLKIRAIELEHRTTTFGYRIEEPDRVGLIPEKLVAKGIEGLQVKELLENGKIMTETGTVSLEEMSENRAGQSFAFVMDTSVCEAAIELAQDVDMLVCESTFMETERELARQYKHLTAKQAGQIASEANANKLVLTHFSARYQDIEDLEKEAREFHDNTIAAKDLDVINFPTRK